MPCLSLLGLAISQWLSLAGGHVLPISASWPRGLFLVFVSSAKILLPNTVLGTVCKDFDIPCWELGASFNPLYCPNRFNVVGAAKGLIIISKSYWLSVSLAMHTFRSAKKFTCFFPQDGSSSI